MLTVEVCMERTSTDEPKENTVNKALLDAHQLNGPLKQN